MKEDLIKNFWWKDCLTNLAWIAFYYQYDRFPGSENFTNVPQVNMPIFFKKKQKQFYRLLIYIKNLPGQMQKG